MRPRFGLCGALTVATMIAPSALPAQGTRWEGQVRDRLRRAVATLGTADQRPSDTTWIGVLNAEESASSLVRLIGGASYTIVGVCDDDCSQLQLTLSTESGNDVAVDRRSESLPVLRLTPATSTRYRLRVELTACLVNPCWYGIAVVRGRRAAAIGSN